MYDNLATIMIRTQKLLNLNPLAHRVCAELKQRLLVSIEQLTTDILLKNSGPNMWLKRRRVSRAYKVCVLRCTYISVLQTRLPTVEANTLLVLVSASLSEGNWFILSAVDDPAHFLFFVA